MAQTVHVILSGGVGSRLWPLSRQSRPKQYVPFIAGQTLFQLCAARNKALCDNQLIVCNTHNYKLTRQDLAELGYRDYRCIVEATPRNTAAAIAFAAFSLEADDLMLVTPSDHIISEQSAYEAAVRQAMALAAKDYLVTFGIKPTKPETGYGYIESEGEDVIGFREKPDQATALKFVESGRFLWNSGIFCFKAGVYLQELEQYEPELYARAAEAWQNKDYQFLNETDSLLIPSKSIDYAVMEKSERIKVVAGDFGWNDLGSFDAIWEYKEENEEEDIKDNNLVLTTKGKHVEFVGVENLILVETEDAILVMQRNQSQEVKAVYDRLQVEHPELLL